MELNETIAGVIDERHTISIGKNVLSEITDREHATLVVTGSVVLERNNALMRYSLWKCYLFIVICHSSQIEPPKVMVVNTENNELNNELTDIEVKLLRHSV